MEFSPKKQKQKQEPIRYYNTDASENSKSFNVKSNKKKKNKFHISYFVLVSWQLVT